MTLADRMTDELREDNMCYGPKELRLRWAQERLERLEKPEKYPPKKRTLNIYLEMCEKVKGMHNDKQR
jgi:hypothetical protein